MSSDMYSDMLKLSAFGGLARLQCGQARPGRLLCQASGAQFCCNIAATRVSHGAILNQIVGGKFNAGNPCIPRISLCRGGFQMAYILPERLLALQHLTSSCEGFEV